MTDEREPDAVDSSAAAPDVEPASPRPQQSGWIVPTDSAGAPSGRRPRLLLGCALVAAAVFVGGPLIALALLDGSGGGGGGGVRAVGFGSGGSACDLVGEADSFEAGSPVHVVATFTPQLEVGTDLTIRTYVDGRERVDDRQDVHIDESSDCLFAVLTPVDSGRYRVEFELEDSAMPPLTGEFEVTPESSP